MTTVDLFQFFARLLKQFPSIDWRCLSVNILVKVSGLIHSHTFGTFTAVLMGPFPIKVCKKSDQFPVVCGTNL